MADEYIVNKNFNGEFKVEIVHRVSGGYELITPIVEDGVKWETEIQGSPGKLTFKVYNDKNIDLDFTEGDGVMLKYRSDGDKWLGVFSGYIFTKKRKKDNWVEVTAYDLLRYFKNKATYVYSNKKASDLVKMIAGDYKLPTRTIENTNYVIGSRVEDDQSLFDIVQNALDLTLISSLERYVLYDDFGKLSLRNINNLKTNIVINDYVAEDFDYTSTIDEETYNEIELYFDNDQSNKREYYNAIDKASVARWGRLRLTESVQSQANVKDRVEKMLKLYNRKNRELKVSKAFGDYRCRAGAGVIVNLKLGDITVNNYMLIEKATHTFNHGEYRMDLTLNGFPDEKYNTNIEYTEENVVPYDPNVPSVNTGGLTGSTGSYVPEVNVPDSDSSYDNVTQNPGPIPAGMRRFIFKVMGAYASNAVFKIEYFTQSGHKTAEWWTANANNNTFIGHTKSDKPVTIECIPAGDYHFTTSATSMIGEWAITNPHQPTTKFYNAPSNDLISSIMQQTVQLCVSVSAGAPEFIMRTLTLNGAGLSGHWSCTITLYDAKGEQRTYKISKNNFLGTHTFKFNDSKDLTIRWDYEHPLDGPNVFNGYYTMYYTLYTKTTPSLTYNHYKQDKNFWWNTVLKGGKSTQDVVINMTCKNEKSYW